MFKETPAGAPPAIQAWFYPGETYGYEFVYPHDQAMKIAQANHQSVLAMKETPKSTTDEERRAAMTTTEVTRIDANGKPVSSDEALKNSSSRRPSSTTTAANRPPAAAPGSTAANAPSTPSSTAGTSTRASTTAQSNAADRNRAVGTNGAHSNTASRSSRRLPRTAGELPLYELLSGLAFAGSFAIRAFRRR